MINVTGLSKWYGARAAIEDLTFSVKKGEIIGLLGPNGAGKSTTMKILTGFMPATVGQVEVCGYDVLHEPLEVKKNIGFLPEIPPVHLDMTVEDYLCFTACLHKVPKQKIASSIQHVLEKLILMDVRHRLIGNLSKGYRQRVGLAQALVHNPKVLVLDEPTVGLDPKQILEIRQLIKSLAGDHTVILSSHILPEVTATCDRVIIINHGKIVAQDSLTGIMSRSQGGRRYMMTVRNATTSGLDKIRALQGVQSVVLKDQGVIEITAQTTSEEIRDIIVDLAVRQSMGVLEFTSEKISLESVFLELTTIE